MPEASPQPPTPPSSAMTSFHVRRAIDGDGTSLSWTITHLTPLLEAQASYRTGSILRRFIDPSDVVAEVWMIALPRLRDLRPRDGRYAPVLMKFLSSALLRRING